MPDFSTAARLAATNGKLPPMAQVLARLQHLLSDVNSSLDDVAALIRLDSALATRVIQVSNSAWFGRGGGSRTIEESVNRVGFKEVFHLVSAVGANAIVAQPLVAYGRDALTMWRESVTCAFAAELLAERLGEDSAVGYMNGLLHGIGRLAVNPCVAIITGDPARQLTDDGFPGDHSVAELALLGYTQADVAACMLAKWGFPPANAEPVRHQYDPLAADVPHDRMSAVLYCARYLRTSLCGGQPAADIPGFSDVLESLPLSRDEVEECLPALKQKVDRTLQMLNA